MSKNFTFNNAPSIQMRRSRINGLSYGVNTSMSLGTLYPIYCEEILPGDSFKVKTNQITRLTSSFIKPIYGNIFADVFYFFVPWRLVYDDFPCVFGENRDGYWANQQEYTVPVRDNQVVYSKSVADYLEMPLGIQSQAVTTMYHRAFALIWNEWFRDENYQEPVKINKGQNTGGEIFNQDPWSVNNYTGLCPPVSKYRDYFTSVLPSPQKGESIGLQTFLSDLPIMTGADHEVNTRAGMQFMNGIGAPIDNDGILGIGVGITGARLGLEYNSNFAPSQDLIPSNLWASVDGAQTMTVNDLRLAFQAQKILERDALGTRYVEHILNTFGVTNPDSRLQRPELLNASRYNINIQQVANTSGTAEQKLASLGAYSLSHGKSGFEKGFSEYGCIIGCMCLRQYHSYQQGTPRRYTRSKRLDYYNPALAYIGMTPVYSTEIFASAPATDIFGYQRAWNEYRHHQNAITGEMRSEADNSLDIWHIGDEYENAPVASAEFITETPNYVDRVISVDSSVQDQFILDIWHDVEAIRVMPSNPMPGLIDHY